jgi:regulator of RNase E activity RraA
MTYGYRAFTGVNRPLATVVQRLAAYSPPNLADAMHKAGTVDGNIRSVFSPSPRFAGPAVTVSLPTGSFNPKKFAMETTQPGDVLVIAARGLTHHSLLGGNLCRGLKHRGLAGIIVDGAVRDVEEMQEVGLPVHAAGIALNSGPKTGPGEVNVPVAVGHCVIFPGDIIVADSQGIAVVPTSHAEEILAALVEVKKKENSLQSTLLRGDITAIDRIRRDLIESGFEILEAAWEPHS